MPKPPLIRGGRTAPAVTERFSPLRLTVRLSFVQPLRRCAPAPLVGEPLAKRRGFPVCQSLPSIGEVASRSDDGEVFPRAKKRAGQKRPALSEVSAYSALVSGFASASGFAAGAAGFAAAGAAGFTTGFGGYGSSFSGKRMIFFGHFWAHIPQPLHLS